jgi:hypothetical protein
MYDDSMSAIYTLCDGKTIAGVEDIGKEGGCAASGGKVEMGHIARYHCLCGNAPNSFLTGADCPRSLQDEARCFHPKSLLHRWYYLNQDRGHRVRLNLRPGEIYSRHYRSLGDGPGYYVPNRGKDPESVNPRYRIRGNGVRTFTPPLDPGLFHEAVYSVSGIAPAASRGIQPIRAGRTGEVVFKVEGANVITRISMEAAVFRESAADSASIAASTTNGRTWKEIWRSESTGKETVKRDLPPEVNGYHEVLVKVALLGMKAAGHARLEGISFRTVTMLNTKTLPALYWGKNTVSVGVGEQTESTVLWPDLRKGRYEDLVEDSRNIVSDPEPNGYQGVLYAASPGEEAHVIFKIDTPRPMTRLTYGGRLYNRAPGSRIQFLHSFDRGKTWTRSYSLTDTSPPWDVIHFEEIGSIPPDTRSVLCKYLLGSKEAGRDACSIYSLRMEADYMPPARDFKPLEVTFHWSEIQEDYSLLSRSHTQVVTSVPFTYTVVVGGEDHPVVNSLDVKIREEGSGTRAGDSHRPPPGEKYTPRRVQYGRNLARGKPYTVTVPSNTKWGAGDPEGKKLTDGILGPNFAGGIGPRHALCWDRGSNPVITVDLGRVESCGGFRIHLSAGWPWWDGLKGEVRDRVEVLTSGDGSEYASQGFFQLNLRRKDIPVNHMMPDDETATGFTYDLIPEEPVRARFVRFCIHAERTLTVSEVLALDKIEYRPFDLRIALPAGASAASPPPGSFAELADLRSACRRKTWRTYQASGYDRGGGFYDSGNFLRIEPDRRYVLMDVKGAGCIDRMWFTRKTGREPYDLVIHVDGEKTPTISKDLDTLWSGREPPFVEPFVGKVDKARYAYVPVGFRRSCKVVLVPTAPAGQYQWRTNSAGRRIPHIYYQITYRRFPESTPLRVFSWRLDPAEERALTRAAALWRGAGAWPWGDLPCKREEPPEQEVHPGERKALLSLQGPGIIYGLILKTDAPNQLILEGRWDGSAAPAVSVPVGAFFASPGKGRVHGLWLGCRKGEYYCYFPMPFWKRAEIAVRSTAETGSAHVACRVLWRRERPSGTDLTLGAVSYDYSSPQKGQDYVVLEAKGRGHFAGVVMDRPGNMEGDDRFYVDGEKKPSIHGTGTEDFFNFAWGFAHLADLPLHGITDQARARVCYRFHLPAAVPFENSFRLSWEHGSENTHAGRYSGVAYFYSDANTGASATEQ